MNYLKIEHEDVCNGIGLRCVIWLTSCSHRCSGCFNKESWNPNNGIFFDEVAKKEIFDELSKYYISGLTLTGGDPLHENNLDEVLSLINEIHTFFPNKTIWLWTGYTWEDVWKNDNYINKKRQKIISLCDVIVDGRYIENKKDIFYFTVAPLLCFVPKGAYEIYHNDKYWRNHAIIEEGWL